MPDPRFTRDGRQLTVKELQEDMRQRVNNQRILPTIDPEILALERANPIKIFSVSPKSFSVDTGLGRYFIPACRAGESYSEALIIPAVIHEPVPTMDIKKMEYRPIGGKKVALDIVGLGHSLSPSRNLIRFGVFIAAEDTFDANAWQVWIEKGKCGDTPSAKELALANKAIVDRARNLVAEADALHMAGPSSALDIGVDHREALLLMRSKGLDVKERMWLNVDSNTVTCPGCQQAIPAGIAKHSCGAVIDWKLARKLRMVSAAEYEEAVADGLVARESIESEFEDVAARESSGRKKAKKPVA